MTAAFRHEALLCHGRDESTAATLDYLRVGIDEDAVAIVVAPAERTRQIRQALGTDARTVRFETVEQLGSNPARLVPFWADQLAASGADGRRVCGVSEALEPESSSELITEFGINEACINVAFAQGPFWTLLCPYDLETHRAEAIEVVRETHPFLTEEGVSGRNPAFRAPTPLAGSLPEPPEDAERRPFESHDLPALRRLAAATARSAGLRDRADDVALVVSELTANSVRHGGGSGEFALWTEDGSMICDFRDPGQITDPLAGRVRPYRTPGRIGGAGLWIANSLSDLVQIRSGASGTSVRVHFDRRDQRAG